jgi:vacuolar-type H+-ATPase subunit B/Vma2
MKKRFIAVAAALALVVGIATFALSKGESYCGEVVEVKGDQVIIKVEKGATDFSVGDSVTLEIKKKKADTEDEYLMGC